MSLSERVLSTPHRCPSLGFQVNLRYVYCFDSDYCAAVMTRSARTFVRLVRAVAASGCIDSMPISTAACNFDEISRSRSPNGCLHLHVGVSQWGAAVGYICFNSERREIKQTTPPPSQTERVLFTCGQLHLPATNQTEHAKLSHLPYCIEYAQAAINAAYTKRQAAINDSRRIVVN